MEQKAELPLIDQLWLTLSKNNNWKKLAWGAVIVALIVFAIIFYIWNKEHTVVSAAEALSAVEAQGAFTPNRNQSPEAYIKVAAEHPNTTAAARALLQAGVAYFTQGKYADAQAQFERLNREFSENPYRSQALLGIATSLEAQSKTDEAARTYKDIADRYQTDTVAAQAKFSLARIYESQGKLEPAQALYEELSRGEINNSIANEAGLKADELRAKLPPKPAAPSPTPGATTAPTSGSAPLLTLPKSPVSTNKP